MAVEESEEFVIQGLLRGAGGGRGSLDHQLHPAQRGLALIQLANDHPQPPLDFVAHDGIADLGAHRQPESALFDLGCGGPQPERQRSPPAGRRGAQPEEDFLAAQDRGRQRSDVEQVKNRFASG